MTTKPTIAEEIKRLGEIVNNINVATKDDVKLPEVGKRYKDKYSRCELKVSKITGNLIILRNSDFNKIYSNKQDFWVNYEELPQDNKALNITT